jgi:hypothetical protein
LISRKNNPRKKEGNKQKHWKRNTSGQYKGKLNHKWNKSWKKKNKGEWGIYAGNFYDLVGNL